MNIEFKILWFEDDDDWLESTEREVCEAIAAHKLDPKIDKHNGVDLDISKLLSNDYDLILMDYALPEGQYGDQIIEAIRNGDVLTDILFYSGQYSEMVESVSSKPELFDGIYFSRRNDEFFNPKLEKLIKKIVRRSEDIINLRGVVLDNTSEFELKMKQIMELVWPKIDEQQEHLNSYSKRILVESQNEMNDTYMCAIQEECCFMAAVQARGYVLDSAKKIRIVNRIAKMLRDNYEFEIPEGYENIVEKYEREILAYRNALGHASSKDKTIKLNGNITVPVDMNLHRQLRESLKGFSDYFDNLTDHITDNM